MERSGLAVAATKSNLVTNPELTIKFQEEAIRATYMLKHRFYSVFDEMDVDDVVSECWRKIISQNISYDPSRSGFRTFVRLIVMSKLGDLVRTCTGVTHVRNTISIDSQYDYGDSKLSLAEVIPDRSSEDGYGVVSLCDELREFIGMFNNVPKFEEIVRMLAKGVTMEDISVITGTDYRTISIAKSVIRQIHYNRSHGKAVPMSDLLYYESQDWQINPKDGDSPEKVAQCKRDWKRWALLIDFTYLIKDEETGVNFSNIIRLILRNFSYKRISEKLNISIERIREMLDMYEPVMI